MLIILTATGDKPDGTSDRVDLTIAEVTRKPPSNEFSGESIIGIVSNGSAKETSSASTLATCFDEHSTPLLTAIDSSEGDTIAAGGTASFSIGLSQGVQCPLLAVGASASPN